MRTTDATTLLAAARSAAAIEQAEHEEAERLSRLSDSEILADVLSHGLPTAADLARRHLASELIDRNFADPESVVAILRFVGLNDLAEDMRREHAQRSRTNG